MEKRGWNWQNDPSCGYLMCFSGDFIGIQWDFCSWISMMLENLPLTGAFYVGNGWVAGGCWDYY